MRVKVVLFDIDGTLIDSNDLHVSAWDEAFRSMGFEIDRKAIHDQIGKGADNLVPTLVPQADEAMEKMLGQAHGDVFKSKFLATAQPFPQARSLLTRVHEAGQKVVWASSASKAELDHYLDLLDARELVSAATSIDDVGSSKPAPDIFETALKKVAPLTADEAIVVGDTPYDIEAARKCGITTIALRSGGFSDEELRGAGAITLYDDVAALLRGTLAHLLQYDDQGSNKFLRPASPRSSVGI